MTTLLDDDNYLVIRLISYDKPTEQKERFYFLGMSMLQVMVLLPQSRKIISSKIVAYTDNNVFLGGTVTETFKNIGDFNEFFRLNPDYYIHNSEIELENGITVGSHDDCEVSIQFPKNSPEQIAIYTIFEKYKLDKSLISMLKTKPGHYIAFDENSRVTGDFVDFDDYLDNGRNK